MTLIKSLWPTTSPLRKVKTAVQRPQPRPPKSLPFSPAAGENSAPRTSAMEPAGDPCAPTAAFCDRFPEYAARADVAFYVEEARRAGGKVLELGCGTGRVLIPVARTGARVWGLDASPAMLARCREKLRAEPPEVQARVDLRTGDMRRLDIGLLFDLILCPFRAFQHLLTADDQVETLHRVHRHLEPGGRFILDIFDPDLNLLLSTRDGEWSEPTAFQDPLTGDRLTRRWRRLEWDRVNQITRNEFLWERARPDGTVERAVHPFALRYLFRWEAEHLLERCGLRVAAVFGDFARRPVTPGETHELILICDRRD